MKTEVRSDAESGATPYAYLLVTMALFGSAFASSKLVVGEVPHQVAALLRFGGGALVLLLLALVIRKGRQPFSRGAVIRAGAAGLVGVFAYNAFFFWGLSLAPSLDGSIIVPVLSPVLTTTFLLLTGRETAGVARAVGLLLGMAGAALFLAGIGAESGMTGARLAGDFIYLLAAACWATYSIMSKRMLGGIDPLRATACATLVGGLALAVLAVPVLGQVRWTDVSGTAWANVAYLVVGPTAVAYLFYYRGLRAVSPSTATIMMFAVPVFGTVCSVAFLGESFTLTQAAGAAVMIVGALLAVTQGRLPHWSGPRLLPRPVRRPVASQPAVDTADAHK
ncbi:DMT family transporter [Geodermatophilus sp. URMC 62]|uniref:DMT family transporter n=1 Tax=Geodermatophilus sp. URMC 62 TaxID=3423414 RepID=UPI00406C8316